MTEALLHTLFVVVPLGTLAILMLMIYARKGNHPKTYSLSEPWTHAPVLWTATDEAIPGHGGHGGHGDELTVGGGASGKW